MLVRKRSQGPKDGAYGLKVRLTVVKVIPTDLKRRVIRMFLFIAVKHL